MRDDTQIEESKNLPQSSQGYPGAPSDADDEINLLDLFMVLVRRKWLIIGQVFLTGVAAVSISLQMRNVYRSEATIAPRQIEQSGSKVLSGALGGLGGMVASEFGLGGGGEVDKIEVLLKSRRLVQLVVEKHNLMPLLFEDQWDQQKKAWKENPAPTLQDAFSLLSKTFSRLSRYRE